MSKPIKVKPRFRGEYKDSIVVFLDLMGIRDFTLTKGDGELFEIYSIIDRFIDYDAGISADPTRDAFTVDLRVILKDILIRTSLSDSILISFPKEYLLILPFVVQQAAMLQLYFLARGLPVRGGITTGKIFHKKDDCLTFGKGLVKAAIFSVQDNF